VPSLIFLWCVLALSSTLLAATPPTASMRPPAHNGALTRPAFFPALPPWGIVEGPWTVGFSNSFDGLLAESSLLDDTPILRRFVARAQAQDIDLLAPENRELFAPLIPSLKTLMAEENNSFDKIGLLRRLQIIELAANEGERQAEEYAQALLHLAIPGVAAKLESYQCDLLFIELDALRWGYGLLLSNATVAQVNRSYYDLHAARTRPGASPGERNISLFATRPLLKAVGRWSDSDLDHLGDNIGKLVQHITAGRPMIGEHGNIRFLNGEEFRADKMVEIKIGRQGGGRSHRTFFRLLPDDRLVLLAVRPRTNVDDSYDAIDRLALRVGDGRQDIVGLDPETHPAFFSWITVPPSEVPSRSNGQAEFSPPISVPDSLEAPLSPEPAFDPPNRKPRANPPRTDPGANGAALKPPLEAPPAPDDILPEAPSWKSDPVLERWVRWAVPAHLLRQARTWPVVQAWVRSGDYARLADYLHYEAAPQALAHWPSWFPWIQDWVRETRHQYPWFDWIIRRSFAVRWPQVVAARLRQRGDSSQAAEMNRRLEALHTRLREIREGRGPWLSRQPDRPGSDGDWRRRLGSALLNEHYAWVRGRYAAGAFTAEYARWANRRVRSMIEGTGEFRNRLVVSLLWSHLDERARILREIDFYPEDAGFASDSVK